MRAILATLIAVAVLGAHPVRAAAPVEPGKVFVGPEGEQVAIIPLSPLEDKKAILLVQSTGGPMDGKVLPYDVEQSGESMSYVTQWHGRPYATIYLQASGSRRTYYLNIPGRRDGIVVTYDDTRTKALKPEDVYAQFQKQKADGTHTKLMAFDRKGEETKSETGFVEAVKSMNAACGSTITATVDWKSISDEVLKKYSISSYCGAALESLEKLCKTPEGKKAVVAQIKEYTCRFGPAMAGEVQSGRLTWTTATDASNQEDFATKYFEENLESARGKGEKLVDRLKLERIRVCSDGKGHYVVIKPGERTEQMSYGDGKRFVEVAPAPWVLGGTYFLEPRFYGKKMNHDFRGLDMGVYSEVNLDNEKKTCSMRCGDRTIPLTWVESDQVQDMMAQAAFEPNPQKFVPYALLRDTQGRYYLVERGFQKSEERNFRVSIGPKGNLQVQKMKDVVADSKGEIFSTTKGELRLVVEREAPSAWIEKSQRLELRAVPVEENMPLIYNELGVYTGARLGTPCDDQ